MSAEQNSVACSKTNVPTNSQKLLKGIKNMDLLTREPVTLMSEGKTHYTTLFGGIMTVLMCFIGFILLVALPSKIDSMELQQVS
jgi:hypothetical protein